MSKSFKKKSNVWDDDYEMQDIKKFSKEEMKRLKRENKEKLIKTQLEIKREYI